MMIIIDVIIFINRELEICNNTIHYWIYISQKMMIIIDVNIYLFTIILPHACTVSIAHQLIAGLLRKY